MKQVTRPSAHHTIVWIFLAFGAVVGTHVGALPFLVERSAISPFMFGIVGAVGMLTNIVVMGFGGVMNRYADHRFMLLFIIPVAYAALWYALLVNSPTSFMLSFIFLSASLGTLDIFMNAEASIVEQDLARPVFSSYHGFASFGIAGFAIISSIVSVAYAPWFGGLLAGVPLALAAAAVYKAIPTRAVRHEDGSRKRVVLPYRILTFIGLAAGFNVACEGAAILWAGQLLTSIAPELAAISGLGVAFYGFCGGTMRMFGDRLRARFGDLRTMATCISMAVAGFVVLGLTPGFWPSVLAFAAVGAGLAVAFPCLFSLAARLVPQGRAAAMGYVALVGGAPRVVLPWVLGLMAAHYSLSAVFAAGAIVAAAALAIVFATYMQADRFSHAQ